MYSFTRSHPNSIKRRWETGRLRGVGNFAWESVFTGSRRKIGWRIVLTIWFFCCAKNGVGNQIVAGGFYWWGNKLSFLATVGDHNPPVEKILTCILKNHNLLFIIKHFEFILGIMKNIWLWTSENILLSTNFRKNTSVNNFQKMCQWWLTKLQ